ncbi:MULTISPECIES: SDR family NAD(P)-dependent oxidoreductase [Achromobacter]|uniref:Gluconate 5-dehydrogenase n=2 Tax=Achromobacter TaxID=222 RepID=A0AAD2IWT3_ACHAE|nr:MULTISPECIES: SDR family NAD(P)-dependent oxidoreductase [Achromobacter]MBD9382116.1 SDR family oxidoreductase [Achromobacter sp. ACM02]MBD9420076.1 SDR family oxidoreductase [Achromobacter sp. ACM04]MBD9431049.1 SDR family oxidoreductase [Achromobacter sp. ACM03]MBD9472614.1 SDR family oxidoreductase [Achromobacter sp. ACM01]MDR7947697.1 SDR family NAD(P)-dependent oxidoreductase [Achromobacter aegrifaciens]
MFEDLRNKRALVTGAFGGLGAEFARTLSAAGAHVALAGRRLQAGEQLAAELAAADRQACAIALDVTQPDSVAGLFDAASERLGGAIDILVNNAGITTARPALEHSEADWMDVIDVNLNGTWRVAQAAGRHMQAHGGGSIINIASILGLRVAQQVPAYAASKAALIQLTQALALEWARHGIRVNALAPGYIETDLNREFFASDAGQALIRRVPQRRLGQARELSAPLLLLASDASSFMTGSVLVVDGGHLISTL